MKDKRLNKNQLTRRYTKWGYIFVIPFVIAFLIFQFLPLAQTFIYAFTDMKGAAGMKSFHFLPSVGKPLFKNFEDILKSKTFRMSFKNTLVLWVLEFVPEVLVGFWLASLFCDRRLDIKCQTIFKTVYFLPKLVSGVTLARLFDAFFIDIFGRFINGFITILMLNGYGFQPEDFAFLSTRSFMFTFLITVINIFMHFGSTFLWIIAGISGISPEVFEAATIDGANRPQTLFRITIPCMRPMILYILVMSLVEALNMYDVPMIFGADGDITRSGITLMVYLHDLAFDGSYLYARASACSIILCIVFSTFSLLFFFLMRDKDEAKLRQIKKAEAKEARLRAAAK